MTDPSLPRSVTGSASLVAGFHSGVAAVTHPASKTVGRFPHTSLRRKEWRQNVIRRCAWATAAAVLIGGTVAFPATANADNKRLNNGVAANVYTVQHQAGCAGDVHINPQLRLAAQWHASDVLADRSLDGGIGSDGSTPQDRANAAGFMGQATETVAINPALSITGVEVMNQWFDDPVALAIMRECANTEIGVWSENSLDRTVLVAVYGRPTGS